jgi:hypothetical protein
MLDPTMPAPGSFGMLARYACLLAQKARHIIFLFSPQVFQGNGV